MTKTAKASSQKIKAIAGLVLRGGTVTLSACSTAAEEVPANTQTPQSSTSDSSNDSANNTQTSAYQDGSYTASGNYRTPGGIDQISVTVDLSDGVITAVSVTGDPQAPESVQYQGQFISGISDAVVGQSIDELSVDRVAGSSLTSGGFNEAITEIKEQAQG